MFVVALVSAEPVRLASVDWPPYTGEKLKQQGEISVLVKQIFSRMQLDLQTEFLPWARAVYASSQPEGLYAGYFPEYQNANPDFILSESLGVSELGFVEATAKPLGTLSFSLLPKFQLGVVKDYVNLTEVDAMIARGQLVPQLAVSDRQNVLKVALGRLDLAIIDRRVLLYLLEHDAEVKQLAGGKVRFNASLTEMKSLHLALRREPAHQLLMEQFNQQLKQIQQGH